MHTQLLDLLRCPQCGRELTLARPDVTGVEEVEEGLLECPGGHTFPIRRGVPRFVQHTLNEDQARSRDSFGYEWTRLYPLHGHLDTVAQEQHIFLEYTRSLPSDWHGQVVLDAGCGNGRYARIASEWGARVVAVDISDAVEVARQNTRDSALIDVIQADLFRLPFRPEAFDVVYSIGVLHHTPDAAGAFRAIGELVRPGGWLAIFVHGRGNRVLYATNRLVRRFTSRASYSATWRFSAFLTAVAKVLTSIPFVGPVLYMDLRQVLFLQPDLHNTFDHYSAGFTSFHTRDEVRDWYRGWADVVVRLVGVATESIYARGTKPERPA